MNKPVNRRIVSKLFLITTAAAMGALLLTFGCGARKASNFGVERWKGRLLSGRTVSFSDSPGKKVILNVYSPTCVPCIHELPALDRIYEKARKNGAAMYIIVEGRPIMHGIQKEGEHFSLIRDRLQQDIRKYGIRIPFVIMDPSFRVSRTEGLVTATPETLILRTRPLILEYNFIGPIALPIRGAAGKPVSAGAPAALVDEQLKRDSRFQFVMSKI